MISFEIIVYYQSSQINDYWAKNRHSLYLGGPLSQDLCYCYLGLGFSGVVGQASGDRCVFLPFVQRYVHAMLSAIRAHMTPGSVQHPFLYMRWTLLISTFESTPRGSFRKFF